MSANTPVDPLEAFEAAVRQRVGVEADDWLAGLPDLISTMTATWDLTITGTATDVSAFGMTIPAMRDEQRVLLRMGYPDGWFADETVALETWNGNGAVRLLEHDARGAHLRSAPDPGTPLVAERNAMRAMRLATGALRALWIPAPAGLQTVSAEVRVWIAEMPARFESTHRPFERSLLHDAEQLFRTYISTQAAPVLLHGDARLATFEVDGDHAVAIDVKPLVGEPAFDVASLLRDAPEDLMADPSTALAALQARLDHLTDLIDDISASRVKGWAFAVAVDMALLAYEGGDPAGGDLMIEFARLCQALTV